MELLTKKPRGTEDKLPKEIYKWHTVEKIARNVAEAYGCKEIRTPTFEHTELFQRGVGIITTWVTLKHRFLYGSNPTVLGDHETDMKAVGQTLMGTDKYEYLLSFEALSILLLVCAIGGILIARKR